MDPYHLKYLKYKNKYVTYKNKYFKIQKGGKNTLEQDIATYTILSVDDELSKLILTQLIIIRNSNDISKLLELKNIGLMYTLNMRKIFYCLCYYCKKISKLSQSDHFC